MFFCVMFFAKWVTPYHHGNFPVRGAAGKGTSGRHMENSGKPIRMDDLEVGDDLSSNLYNLSQKSSSAGCRNRVPAGECKLGAELFQEKKKTEVACMKSPFVNAVFGFLSC